MVYRDMETFEVATNLNRLRLETTENWEKFVATSILIVKTTFEVATNLSRSRPEIV